MGIFSRQTQKNPPIARFIFCGTLADHLETKAEGLLTYAVVSSGIDSRCTDTKCTSVSLVVVNPRVGSFDVYTFSLASGAIDDLITNESTRLYKLFSPF